MNLNIPNMLTMARLFMIPIFIAIFYLPIHFVDQHQQNLIATIIFAVAALTDWLDGYLARKLNQTTALGAFMDPVVDKFFVAAALVILVQLGRIDASIAIIIIGREIGISALREWMAKIGASDSVAVSYSGKVKTAVQMLAITFLISQSSGTIYSIGHIMILIATCLTLFSMFIYLKNAIGTINSIKKDKIIFAKPSNQINTAKV